jgi:hypothetical protein
VTPYKLNILHLKGGISHIQETLKITAPDKKKLFYNKSYILILLNHKKYKNIATKIKQSEQ